MTSNPQASDLVLERPQGRPPFPIPKKTTESAFYWESGADDQLRILRCPACSTYIHPPSPRCFVCGSREPAPVVVSGRGRIYTYTISIQPFIPDFPPYCVGLVEIEEDPSIRLAGMLVGCNASDLAVGLPVVTEFQQLADDVWVPCFRVVAA